jgi:hypothetical protein
MTTTPAEATPLTPPSLDDLEQFANTTYDEAQAEYVEMMLQQATDALWAYTGIDTYPDDSTEDGKRRKRIIKNAIMALALWAMTQAESRHEIDSPFSSETIGSYHYSLKMQQAQTGSSGIWWLDMLFKMLGAGGDSGMAWVDSERVFSPNGETYEDLIAQGLEPTQPPWLDTVYGVWRG